MTTCYLRIGSDYIEDAIRHPSIASAKDKFEFVARQLDRCGQRIEATIHIAATRDEVNEYPDYVLRLGPRGGVQMNRA